MPPLIPTIAYIAEGKLYTKAPGKNAQLVQSGFVQAILDRAEKSRERNDWKSGAAWQFSSRGFGTMGLNAAPAEIRRVNFVGLASGSNTSDIFYSVDTDYACGLFQQDLDQGYEKRLYHRNQFRASDLSRCPETGTLAFVLKLPDGSARLATMSPEGRGFKEVTEGDAVDEAPSWVPGEKNVLLFQSAGIGRNQAGHFVGLSPYAVQKIDLNAGRMEVVIEEDTTDTLMPCQDQHGSLYFIRRPYLPHGPPVSAWRLALSMLMFPIGVLVAVAHFLNVFSLLFSKKPLISTGGPERPGPDHRLMILYGQMIDAKNAARSARRGEAPALVPATWMLVCRQADQSERILAKHALAYDLCSDGGVVWTDGSRIHHLAADGTSTEISKGKFIERVVAVG